LVRHFVRGYFDGDGCVSYRLQLDKRYNELRQFLTVRFISGSRGFLESLRDVLRVSVQVGNGSISSVNGSYQLQYAMKDSIILFGYFYGNVSENCLLSRKYQAFKVAINEINGGVV
jgi:intein/homing endonuclease